MSEWISVEDRLPNEDEIVVGAVFYPGGMSPDAAIFKMINGRLLFRQDGLMVFEGNGWVDAEFDPTHWKPLF